MFNVDAEGDVTETILHSMRRRAETSGELSYTALKAQNEDFVSNNKEINNKISG